MQELTAKKVSKLLAKIWNFTVSEPEFTMSSKYGSLKKKCILRQAKAKLKMEKKMTLPILPTPLCCSASNQHKAQLTTIKKDGGRVLKKGMHFLFLEITSPAKHRTLFKASFKGAVPLIKRK